MEEEEAERRPDVSQRAAAVIVAIVGTRRRRHLVESGVAERAAMAGVQPLSLCRRAAQEAASKRRVVVVMRRRRALGVRRAPQSGEAVATTMRVMKSRGRWLEEVEAGGAIAEEGVLTIRLEVADQVRMVRRRASVGRIDAVGAAHDVLYGCCVYVSVA